MNISLRWFYGTQVLVLLIFLVSFPSVHRVHAQDSYHSTLLTQLETEYGVTGGSFVISNTENGVLGRSFNSGNVSQQNVTVTDQSFSRAVRLTVPVRGANPWDYFIGFSLAQGFNQGDRGILVVWARSNSAERGGGLMNVNIEKNASPWTKSLVTGVTPSSEWQQWILPFEASIPHPSNEVQVILHLGVMAQDIELGGLTMINYGTSYSMEELPATNQDQDYDGRLANAPWRADAEARIESMRKRDLRVQILDNRGLPASGVPVRLTMNRHHFGFGSAVAVGMMIQQGADGATYREKLEDITGEGHRFSIAVLENALKWDAWEENWPGTIPQKLDVLRQLRDLGMAVRGHNLVWPGWDFLPNHIPQFASDPAGLAPIVEARIRDMASYPGVQGELVDWDVINEPAHLTDLAEVFAQDPAYATGEEVYAEWFNFAAEADPNARLYINEYGIITNLGLDLSIQERYKEIIEKIEQEGGIIHGVGVQGHMSTPLTPPETVYDILDDFAEGGKELSITEYDASGVEETLAADYMRDLLTIAFSHPSVTSFLMWGFWDGAHWRGDAPLFRRDWTLKPSGQAFFDLVFDTWWTDEELVSDESGYVNMRGFMGDYDVIVHVNGSLENQALSIEPGEGMQESTITLAQQVSVGQQTDFPQDFRIEGHYPEPAGHKVTISLYQPHNSHVQIEVFNMLGQQVGTFYDADLTAGRHAIALDTRILSSGTYFYRVSSDAGVAQELLTIRK